MLRSEINRLAKCVETEDRVFQCHKGPSLIAGLDHYDNVCYTHNLVGRMLGSEFQMKPHCTFTNAVLIFLRMI